MARAAAGIGNDLGMYRGRCRSLATGLACPRGPHTPAASCLAAPTGRIPRWGGQGNPNPPPLTLRHNGCREKEEREG
eukprot:9316876-Pyramimonas_sp.AAC.1